MLDNSIEKLKGVGPQKYKEFCKLGVKTIEDLIYYFPRTYQDRSQLKMLHECIDQEKAGVVVKIIGRIQETKIRERKLYITKVPIEDKNHTAGEMVWFNNSFIKHKLAFGQTYFVYGKVKKSYNRFQIESPDIKVIDEQTFTGEGIIPIYKSSSKISLKEIQKLVQQAFHLIQGEQIEYLSETLRRKYKLCEMNFALENIHFPSDIPSYKIAKKRLIFDEFFLLQMALRLIKKQSSDGREGIILKDQQTKMKGLLEELPFSLTDAQRRVLQEIIKDFGSGKKMNRLLQGDVGSGKTIIAILALYFVCLNGYQGAMMAPTEILAMQHYDEVKRVLSRYNIKLALLTKNINTKEKAKIIDHIKEGKVDIVIGTHSIIQENILFNNLALVITDEQHRFGVRQRSAFNKKGPNPHILVMTATPIPRTLSFILYGDLDISILDELPPGRKIIKTYHIRSNMEHKLYHFIKQQIHLGRQAYIVCPLVEESENIEGNSVLIQAEYLSSKYFKKEKLAFIHGKMKGHEKEAIMKSFQEGHIDILIATSLIEVGVNVPNANIMVIQNAERFGLAQLHQLRGRVGRGDSQAYCFLVSDYSNSITMNRIQTMLHSNNGFIIAEKDLKLRGPGEFLGVRQHGLPELKIADLFRDIDILKLAQQACKDIETIGEFPDIEDYIKKYFNKKISEITLN